MSDEMQSEELGELKNGLEVLVNILFLIREDRRFPDRVLRWVDIADQQAQRITRVVPGFSLNKL